MTSQSTKRICLWSGPRNISTALMYSFAQRSDTRVFDEPLYAHYLQQTNADTYHPGAKEILENMENDGSKVVEMMMGSHDRPVVFFKNMTHHLLKLDRSFMADVLHVILTRDPVEMLPSFAKVIEHPTMDDVGYALHIELLDYFQKIGVDPIVLDSKKVLLNPTSVLTQLCDRLGISFDENMLKWPAKARPEDGVWAKYWYESIHKSTAFMPYKPKVEPFPEYLKPLLEACNPYYESLEKLSIKG